MFAFLGNGFSSAEKRTGDLSYYIRNGDDSAVDPCLKGPVGVDGERFVASLQPVTDLFLKL